MTIAEHHDTIVIGAGQAGLATGYHLARRGVDFVILESHDRVGDNVWRNRFDSLKLYSPGAVRRAARHAHHADASLDLAGQARHGGLPRGVRRQVRAARPDRRPGRRPGQGRRRLHRVDQRHRAHSIERGDRDGWLADADRTRRSPISSIPRSCSCTPSEYRNPTHVQPGPVLVVGCAHSGADIALELAGDPRGLRVGADPRRDPVRHREQTRCG